MKIKNKTYAGLCGGLLLGLVGCDSFLDEDPRSSVTSASYYKTEAQARENVTALYRMGAPVRYAVDGSAYTTPTAAIGTVLTGYFTNSYEGQEQLYKHARELTRQQNTSILSGTMNTIWRDAYRAINIANGAIKHVPDIAMDANLKNRLIAEAKFFRAFNYFYLVKTFGAIPQSTEPYESLDNIFLPRTEPEQIYTLIESDLKASVDALPDALFVGNKYRLTKHVAAMALANVYLQQEKYADAASYAEILVNSAHALAQNDDMASGSAYNKLRTQDNLPETIYSYEFDAAISHSGWRPTHAFSATAVSVFDAYSIFERTYGPTDRFLNVYDANDLRIQPNQFYHWNYTHPTNGKTWTSTLAGIWYFADESALLSTGRGTKDWNIYRYAETLLIAAEALAKSSNTVSAKAAGYLAQIKARADVNGKTVAAYTTELQALSVDDFVQECWRERLRELPLEYKMWDDCLRTGMFPLVSETVKGKIDFVPLVGAQNASGATFKDTDLLWPISIEELQRNPELTQNTGYQR